MGEKLVKNFVPDVLLWDLHGIHAGVLHGVVASMMP